MDLPDKIGRYEILEELGHGAMGTVYRAKDPSMDRVVALKTIISVALAGQQEKEYRERFYREARAAGGLAHPGIVTVFDVGEHEGMPFLVMEFIKGHTLDNAVKTGERLSLERTCEIGQRVAEALGYAHQHGVIHRDIKPANILMTSREAYGIERPKIADFGVAKLAEGRSTLTGQLLGTPAFMPPEQFTGGPIDGRADLFSLGVVLYWMATGEQPFPGESITAVSYKVVHTEPVPPRKLNPWVPVELDNVIMKCLAKSPDERYQTGEELAQQLARLRQQGKVGGTPPPEVIPVSDPNAPTVGPATIAARTAAAAQAASAPQPPAPPSASSKSKAGLRWVVACGVAVVVTAGGWYAMRFRHKPETRPAIPSASAASSLGEKPAPEKPVPSADTPPLSTNAGASDNPRSADASGPVPHRPSSATSTPSMPASGTRKTADARPDAKAPAKASPNPPPKAPAPPEPAPVAFDPKALDPKQNAKLKIESKHLPAGVDFTVEMNGKLYFQRTSAGNHAQDDELFVPPGVQEFRVTAKNGAVKKVSNTVSAEFKAKKKLTLKIELRSQGLSPEAAQPQGLYADTQLVVGLK
jgi:eukaryotic-like serine/threonine-protein kinase